MVANISSPVGFLFMHPAPYLYPALERYAAEQSGGIEVWYVHRLDAGHPQWRLGSRQLREHHLNAAAKDQNQRATLRLLWRRIRMREYGVFVVSGYNTITSLATILMARLFGTPVVLVLDSIDGPRPWYKRMSRAIPLRVLYSLMAAFWVPGEGSRQYLLGWGVAAEKIFEGCYTLDSDVLAKETTEKDAQRTSIREAMGLRPSGFLFLMAARLIPSRHVFVLLGAFEGAKAQCPDIQLMIVGDGPDRPKAEEHANTRHLKDVHFTSQVDFTQLKDFYAAADAFVMPSEEPYSLALVQAAISARPMIASDTVGASKDFIVPGQSGLVYEGQSIAGLTSAMIAMATNTDDAKAMGRRAQARALRRNASWAAEQLGHAVRACLEKGSLEK